ncbi:MAG TPA: helix-turn-helix domain-containing protein [Solirubrobacteraceae bacterium]|jgi:excisionase family DNA binding protein|nr:helix-turn-helix domain-containing protein [Solirubrobacteraceae bacterium]
MHEVAITLPPDLVDLIADVAVERLAARQPPAEPWVGVDAAAAHLCCRRQRIYDLVGQRRIPHRKEGARLLFKLSHLDAWIEGGAGG